MRPQPPRSKSLQSSTASPKARSLSKSSINAKYSNIPIDIPVLYPSYLKNRGDFANAINIYENSFSSAMNSANINFQPKPHNTASQISKGAHASTVESLMNQSRRQLHPDKDKRARGSMSVNELWGVKHCKEIIKTTNFTKQVYDSIKQAKQVDLTDTLDKLETMYAKRKPSIQESDPNIYLEKFRCEGLNMQCLKSPSNMSHLPPRKHRTLRKPSIQLDDSPSNIQVDDDCLSVSRACYSSKVDSIFKLNSSKSVAVENSEIAPEKDVKALIDKIMKIDPREQRKLSYLSVDSSSIRSTPVREKSRTRDGMRPQLIKTAAGIKWIAVPSTSHGGTSSRESNFRPKKELKSRSAQASPRADDDNHSCIEFDKDKKLILQKSKYSELSSRN